MQVTGEAPALYLVLKDSADHLVKAELDLPPEEVADFDFASIRVGHVFVLYEAEASRLLRGGVGFRVKKGKSVRVRRANR